MKIKEIDITGIGDIRNLHIKFNDSMNILCGPNGIGKTTILESVASMFTYGSLILKRNVSADRGQVSAKVEINGQLVESHIVVSSFMPSI